MKNTLEASSRYCRRLARARAQNFYYGFLLLPKPRREAFYAVYAFMRYCDDVADGEASVSEKAIQLENCHQSLDRALAGDYGDSLIWPAFHRAVRQYSIPVEYLHELITGTEMDLTIRSYRTFEDLYHYCYRVAAVVGLCSLYILGFRDPAAKKLAEECGIAFQLTNILRDLREDVQNGRVYLPLEDLERFHYSPEELMAAVYNQQFRELMQFEIERASQFYERAYPLIEMVEPETRSALWALISIYRGILRSIERNDGNVFSRPAVLSDMEKIHLVLQAARMCFHRDWNEAIQSRKVERF
ncbi:MAG: phytoene/squalene synthase family protein [Acidobacteria bacterium]|nr:phytoene/squalene synthase family protein [Acidobacteriota bacterium]